TSGIAYAGIMTGDFDVPFRIARFDPGGEETTIHELERIHARGEDLAGTPDGGVGFVIRGTTPTLRKIDATGAVVWERLMDFSVYDDECRRISRVKALGIAVEPARTIHVVLAASFSLVI